MSAPPLTALAAAVLHVPAIPERILEICCDRGDGVFFLAREFPTARVRGVDASEKAVREAVAQVGLDPEGRVAFKQGRPRSLPYPDDLFDLVVQRHGRLVAGEATRVLRPGGYLVYVDEPPGARLRRLRAGALQWRLATYGFDTLGREQSGDARFWVGRLGGD